MRRTLHLLFAFLSLVGGALANQQAPEIGYMFPPGGLAGEVVEVQLGGHDWTPDMQVFVHDPRIQLELLAPPGPILVPEPPYWIGKKSRRTAEPLPRETRARLTIGDDVEPGVVCWQAANANGVSACGRFMIGQGRQLLEIEAHQKPQSLGELPVTVAGRIERVAEVDRYLLRVGKTGPVTCVFRSHAIGSKLNAILEIRDAQGNIVADFADTSGQDKSLTFRAEADAEYTASIFDVDFRGNRAFVYQVSFVAGPRVVAAIPAAGRRGKKQTVKFVGYGVATGNAQLEAVTREIELPKDSLQTTLAYQLETEFGVAPAWNLPISNLRELVEPAQASSEIMALTFPAAVTGVIDQPLGTDRYRCRGNQGDVWNIEVFAARLGSPLDVLLTVHDSAGKELARQDDAPNSADSILQFTVPEDGIYELAISDGVRAGRLRNFGLPAGRAATDSGRLQANVSRPFDRRCR